MRPVLYVAVTKEWLDGCRRLCGKIASLIAKDVCIVYVNFTVTAITFYEKKLEALLS
jgi:hypothetical protein